MSFDEFAPLVEFGTGHVSVAFLQQSEGARRNIANGTVRSTRSEEVYVDAFQSSARNSWTARLFAMLPRHLLGAAAKGYTESLAFYHCELAMYLNGAGRATHPGCDLLCISVTVDGVRIRPRKTNVKYAWIHVACASTDMIAMLHWCCERNNRRYSMSRLTNVGVFPGRAQETEWFCTQLLMGALAFTPHAQFHLNPCNKLTVDDLHDLLLDEAIYPAKVTHMPAVLVERTLKAAYHLPTGAIAIDTRRSATFDHGV